MDFSIKVYRSLNSELKEHWQNLEQESCGYCFQSYDWFENWTNTFRISNNKHSLCIVVVFFKSKVLCIFPLEIERNFNLSILKWAGGDQADYCGPILSKTFSINKEQFVSLWEKIIESISAVDIVYLCKQPEYVEDMQNPFVLHLKNYRDSNIYHILLPKTWKEYTNSILKKNFLLQNLRKKKQLKKLGNLKFRIATTKVDKDKFIDSLIDQKNKRLSSFGHKDVFKLKNLNFYKEFENKQLRKIKTHVSSLILNDELIAIHWGVIYNNRFYYLLLSMKEGNLGRYSPGRLLISLLVRWSISKKLKIFDFTLGEENYKKNWSNSTSGLFNHVRSNTLRGFLIYFLIKTKLILKSLDKKNYLRKIILFVKKIF